MALHKYMNPMLLLKNQPIYPFLWYCLPFLCYRSLHFSFISRLVGSPVQGLLDMPPALLNWIHIRARR